MKKTFIFAAIAAVLLTACGYDVPQQEVGAGSDPTPKPAAEIVTEGSTDEPASPTNAPEQTTPSTKPESPTENKGYTAAPAESKPSATDAPVNEPDEKLKPVTTTGEGVPETSHPQELIDMSADNPSGDPISPAPSMDIFARLNALNYCPETCDSLPQYILTAPDGTFYYLNFLETSYPHVQRNGREEAQLPADITAWLIENGESVGMVRSEYFEY